MQQSHKLIPGVLESSDVVSVHWHSVTQNALRHKTTSSHKMGLWAFTDAITSLILSFQARSHVTKSDYYLHCVCLSFFLSVRHPLDEFFGKFYSGDFYKNL
jgi:hypothetical protein